MSRTRSGVVGLGLAMVMLLPGCPSESLTVADTYNELGRTMCTKLHECRDTSGLPPDVFVELFGNNPDECVAILQPELDVEAAQVQIGRAHV